MYSTLFFSLSYHTVFFLQYNNVQLTHSLLITWPCTVERILLSVVCGVGSTVSLRVMVPLQTNPFQFFCCSSLPSFHFLHASCPSSLCLFLCDTGSLRSRIFFFLHTYIITIINIMMTCTVCHLINLLEKISHWLLRALRLKIQHIKQVHFRGMKEWGMRQQRGRSLLPGK